MRGCCESHGCDLLWMPAVGRHLSGRLRDERQRRRRIGPLGRRGSARAISTVSPPSLPSSCCRFGPMSRCSARRTSSNSPSSAAWSRTSSIPVEIVGVPTVREAGRPRPVLAQCVSVRRRARTQPRNCSPLSKPPGQRSSPGSRSPERSARDEAALLVAGFSRCRLFRAGRCGDARAARFSGAAICG